MTTKDFILSHFKELSITQMATELGLSQAAISTYCNRLDVKPITEKQQRLNFIKDNPTLSPEKVADALKIHPVSAMRLMKEAFGIKPKPQKRELPTKPEPYIKSPQAKKETVEEDDILPVAKSDGKLAEMGHSIGYGGRKGIKGFKDQYNQSSSPFGLADELSGIKRTK